MSLRGRGPSLDRFIGLYIWLFFIVVFGLWVPDTFLTMATVHSIASNQAITALLAIAVLIPLAAGQYDLSAGAAMNLSTIVAIWLQADQGVPMVPAIAISIAMGVLIGVMNGFVVVKLRVNSFIATLGMASVLVAFQSIIVGPAQPYPPSSTAWPKLTATTIGGFQLVVLYLLIIAFAVWWLLSRTATGRYVYAIGGNPEAARLAGVPVDRKVFMSFVLAGLVSSVGGVFYGSLYGPSLTYGSALLLPAFAAAFLGSVLMRGKFNVWGTVSAVYILATGVQGLQFATSATWLNDMFNGVVLISAVSFAMWRQRAVSKLKMQETAAQRGRGRDDAGEPPPFSRSPAGRQAVNPT